MRSVPGSASSSRPGGLGLAITPVIRPVLSSRTGPVTFIPSTSLAPDFCAVRASVSSNPSLLRISP